MVDQCAASALLPLYTEFPIRRFLGRSYSDSWISIPISGPKAPLSPGPPGMGSSEATPANSHKLRRIERVD